MLRLTHQRKHLETNEAILPTITELRVYNHVLRFDQTDYGNLMTCNKQMEFNLHLGGSGA